MSSCDWLVVSFLCQGLRNDISVASQARRRPPPSPLSLKRRRPCQVCVASCPDVDGNRPEASIAGGGATSCADNKSMCPLSRPPYHEYYEGANAIQHFLYCCCWKITDPVLSSERLRQNHHQQRPPSISQRQRARPLQLQLDQ